MQVLQNSYLARMSFGAECRFFNAPDRSEEPQRFWTPVAPFTHGTHKVAKPSIGYTWRSMMAWLEQTSS